MKKKLLTEHVMHVLFLVCGLVTIGCVAAISLYMIISGIPAIREIGLIRFLFGVKWASTASEPSYGILAFNLSSVCGTLGACVLGVPLGIMMAVFLSKMARPGLESVIRPAVELMAGIPSVVYGLIGMTVLVPFIQHLFRLKNGTCLLAVIIVLTVMILPSVISLSETALSSVPGEYEEASLALGATKMETVFKVSIPAAGSGIAAGVVLGVGRAMGEAMAVMMVAGNVPNMPKLFSSVTLLTTAIAKEMSYASGLQRQALYSIGLVLFVFVMLINLVLHLALKRGDRK